MSEVHLLSYPRKQAQRFAHSRHAKQMCRSELAEENWGTWKCFKVPRFSVNLGSKQSKLIKKTGFGKNSLNFWNPFSYLKGLKKKKTDEESPGHLGILPQIMWRSKTSGFFDYLWNSTLRPTWYFQNMFCNIWTSSRWLVSFTFPQTLILIGKIDYYSSVVTNKS